MLTAAFLLAAQVSLASADPAMPAPPEAPPAPVETSGQRDARMAWWRDARFGMFIHWGLYAIPAGKWGDRDSHGEWIRTTAQIPLAKYDEFVPQFNPVKFDADQWMSLAERAGMRYVVITSKHHDGFALFDSQVSDFDVMATPFKRDIMKEIAEAARRHDLVPCWYHSIMDWHHPDYLPRRDWEKDRSAEGADFDRFEKYLHAQVRELLTSYGDIGVLWFDGEWENTWNHERGSRLYDLCRSLQPSIIVNNRVDKGRNDMAGLTREGNWKGDFGTPEQEVPPQGIPGVDWESCMTMNDHWGWNAADPDWKSTKQLIHTLVDVVSKGGNYLLNVGPRADGTFPPQAVERLEAIGRWMDVNGESIHGTTASLFGLMPWGRSTTKTAADGSTTVYVQLFERPADGAVVLPGLWDLPAKASVLGTGASVQAARSTGEPGVRLSLPDPLPSSECTVLRLDFPRHPEVLTAPVISPPPQSFIDGLSVTVATPAASGPRVAPKPVVRFSVDGSAPSATSPILDGPLTIDRTTTVRAQVFRDGVPASPVSSATYTKVVPRQPAGTGAAMSGLAFSRYGGRFDRLPDWSGLTSLATGTTPRLRVPDGAGADTLLIYEGLLLVDEGGMREFALISDDGAKLWIGDDLVVDNDGLHGTQERRGQIALMKGWHPIRVAIFNRTGGFHLEVKDGPVGGTLTEVAAERLGR